MKTDLRWDEVDERREDLPPSPLPVPGGQADRARFSGGAPIFGCRMLDCRTLTSALDIFDAGMDLADALHLAHSRSAAVLVTFDRRLARRAKARGCSLAVDLLS